MTPAARIAAAIDLLEVIEGAPKRPADAVANDFFRSRRYIGSGDRRAVSERVWSVLRARRRLGWWLGDAPATPRLLVAASLLLEGWTKAGVVQTFSGGQFAAPPLDRGELAVTAQIEGHTLDHPEMPDGGAAGNPRLAAAPAAIPLRHRPVQPKWRRCRSPPRWICGSTC